MKTMKSSRHVLPAVVIVTLLLTQTHCDVFRSTWKIQNLLLLENLLAKSVKGAIYSDLFVNEEQKAKILQFAEQVQLSTIDHTRTEDWCNNPINSLRLLKRFVYYWDNVIDELETDTRPHTEELLDYIRGLQDSNLWPTVDDVSGAYAGLLRLVFVYNLDLADLAHGVIRHTSTTPLSSSELKPVADLLYESAQFLEASIVYNTTLSIAGGVYDDMGLDVSDLYYRFHSSLHQIGANSRALAVLKEAIQKFPSHSNTEATLNLYETTLQRNGDKGEATFIKNITLPLYGADCSIDNLCYYEILQEVIKNQLKNEPNSADLEKQLKEVRDVIESNKDEPGIHFGEVKATQLELYSELCQGEVKSAARLSKLYCEYQRTSNPFMRAKKEYVNFDPDVVVYHDIISHDDCDWIIKKSADLIQPSGVMIDGSIDDLRISETAWLRKVNESDVVQKIENKIEMLTGLIVKQGDFDELQVVNYGLGGMYAPHYDSFVLSRLSSGAVDVDLRDDRIATFGIYLSDVELGGATVFPLIKTRVHVQKGSALFWWNFNRDGRADPLSLHAGCPVLHGSKWFANKWIHMNDQMFNRPCISNV